MVFIFKNAKKVAPKIKRIITPSNSSKHGIINEFKCKELNITVINNGLDTNEFAPIKIFQEMNIDLLLQQVLMCLLKGLRLFIKSIKNS